VQNALIDIKLEAQSKFERLVVCVDGTYTRYKHLLSYFVFAFEFAWSIHVVNAKYKKKKNAKLQTSLPNVVLQA